METIFKLIILITFFSSCKKEKLEGDFATLEGKYRCVSKYTESTNTFLNVVGTEFEHNIYLLSCGKYEVDFPNKKSQRGRVVSIVKLNDFNFDLQLNSGLFTENNLLKTDKYRFILSSFSPTSLVIQTQDGSYHYERM